MSLDTVIAPVPVEISKVQPIDIAPGILTEIYQPQYNLALWKRTLTADLTTNIEQLLQEQSHLALVQTVTPDDAAQWIKSKLEGYACADALGEDIALIVDMFCCLFDVREAGLRLTALDTPMCPKFHVDHVPCRLVSTYVGTATQWLNNDDVDRTKLGAGSLGQPDHVSGLIKNGDVIQQMQPGDVALLKGSGWEGNEETGLVHRSPQRLNDERRLLLTLDLV
ncbi:DUF1826 domain-containing protein [Vibrio brasiliensis]|uniref:DUF1826 domain-containing protein n=1 Tax=Vibrio brasiliensis TaxID=170652 RepID=UPI001EFD0EA0|nr:DUF1826 domain-containing protein [Vibrio brasiliensis]MCG9784083.1 DUF1826 domain-containing protein [Vibrio brasiliensis]